METKINETKEFAIGTNIEYNGKLYEVIEHKFCDECSIAHICSNNDIDTNKNSDNILVRDKRISIFGECSSIVRSDGKSVVFKEISADDDVYDVEVLYKNDKELLPIRINIPSGYTIDIENSDLANNIIKFKHKWLSLEQLYKLAKESHYLTNRSAIKEFRDGKLVALANLMDISRYFNGDWNYDVNQDDAGYLICYDRSIKEPCYNIHEIDSTIDVYYGNPVFKNKADAQYVIDNPNFRTILDKIFKA